MSDIKGLLEKWSQLEPQLCKRETRSNQDWHEEFEDYLVKSPKDKDGTWYLVYSDRFQDNYQIANGWAEIRIQWAVQQAIIEKGWYFNIWQNYNEYRAETGPKVPSPFFSKSDNPAEALLTAYLKTLEAN